MRFNLVRKILELVPGQRAVAEAGLDADEELFQDHFPGFPVVPGVILTEMMGQTAAKALNAEERPRGLAMLFEIRNARFRGWVQPGDCVRLAARITTNTESVAGAVVEASVNGKTVASCELLFAFRKRDQFAPDYCDPILESYLGNSQ